MRALISAMAVTMCTIVLLCTPANAQEATPTPINALGLDDSAVAGTVGASPRISWKATAGVDHYRLTAKLRALRVNTEDPFCAPPAQADSTTVSVDETLSAATTEFEVSFPPVTGNDAWFVYSTQIQLRAFDGSGTQVGGQGGGFIGETLCARPTPAPDASPTIGLP